MALPTRNNADLPLGSGNYPLRVIIDATDTDPFFYILDGNGIVVALGLNLFALFGESSGSLIAEMSAGEISTAELADDAVTDAKILSDIVKEPGRIAMGLVDFNATGDCTSVDVGATAVYTRHDNTPDLPNGVWEDGASGTESATNLAAAINGDTRNAGGPYYAAVAAGTTCWIMGLAVGTENNVAIVKTGGTDPDVQENLVGGAAATPKKTVLIQHTVTTEEGTQVELVIPLPFDAAFFEYHLYDSSGGILVTEVTDQGTVTNAAGVVPAYFKIATNGSTHIQAGQILRLTVQE